MKKERAYGPVAGVLAVVFGAAASAGAEIIFRDTFDHTGAILADLNHNLAVRQAGGATGSTYAVTYRNQAAGTDAFLQNASNPLGSAVLLARIRPTADAQDLVMDLDTDFGPSLSGQAWSLSYRGHISDNVGAYSGWTGFAVGNPANAVSGLNNGFGMLLRPGGGYEVYSRGANIGSGNLGIGGISGTPYLLTATFNEALQTVSVAFETASTNVAVGTYATDFVDGGRFFELKSTVAGNAAFDGTKVVDWRVDDLAIQVFPHVVIGYEEWAAGYGLPDTGGGAMGEDFDGDGVSNLAEFALGGNPTNSADRGNLPVSAIVADGGTNWLEYVHYERNDKDEVGLSYAPENAEDLVFGPWADTGFSFVGSGAFDAGFDAVTNRIPADGADARFVRLLIQLQE